MAKSANHSSPGCCGTGETTTPRGLRAATLVWPGLFFSDKLAGQWLQEAARSPTLRDQSWGVWGDVSYFEASTQEKNGIERKNVSV